MADQIKMTLPVGVRDKFQDGLANIDKALESAQSPADIVSTQKALEGLKALIEGQGATFFEYFELGKRWVRGDIKLYSILTGKVYLTYKQLAKVLPPIKGKKRTSNGVKQEVRDLKRAYGGKSADDIEALFQKAFDNGIPPSRRFFIMGGQITQTSHYAEWYTPPKIFHLSKLVMGGEVDLDPATHPDAIKMGNVAKKYFTKENDGLKQDWGKGLRIFCNPPFTLDDDKKTPGVLPFLKKLLATDFSQAIFITPEDSSVSYGNILWGRANVVCIPKNRMAFYKDGFIQTKPNKTTLIWGLGVDAEKFLIAFRDIGRVVKIEEFKEGYTALIDKHIGTGEYGVNFEEWKGVYIVSPNGEELVSNEMIVFYRKVKKLSSSPLKNP